MRLRAWPALAAALAAATVLTTGCGGSGSRSASPQSAAVVLMARAPNSLDPAVGDTPEALEADWLAYTPLLTYAHAGGSPGTQVIPGLAQYLPTISDGGMVYTFTLIKGLRYSNGQPVRATDFTWAAERAIRLWPDARRLIVNHLAGAAAFAAGRAKTISGIAADDANGQITIRLTAPYGAFEDVLALPVLAPVPAGTPFSDQQATPPAGVGPYRIVDVVPGRSFSLRRTPEWAREGVASVPAGHLDIDVKITGDAAKNALSVLDNAGDVFDWPDQIPSSLVGRIERGASRRYHRRTVAATDLIFLNVTRKPFSSQLAREAVRAGLDRTAIAALGPGPLVSGCYVLPPAVPGHPTTPCGKGKQAGRSGLTLARALVNESGMAGTRVVVWTNADSPVNQWMAYYTSLLNRIGFDASLRYGSGAGDPQTGYSGLETPLPNPAYFYDQLTGAASPGRVDDGYVNATTGVLSAIPGSTLRAIAGYWSRLELYVADKAYVVVLGYPTFPEFVSSRIDSSAVVFSPVAGVDWSSLRLK